MCEIELAWLKAERRLYTSCGEERGRLRLEVERHLRTLEDLEKRTGGSLTAYFPQVSTWISPPTQSQLQGNTTSSFPSLAV